MKQPKVRATAFDSARPRPEKTHWLLPQSPVDQWFPGFLVLIAAALLALNVGLSVDRTEIRGWEARDIASAVAGGHGFSYPAPGRWLTDDLDRVDPLELEGYVPTAWVDPVYTFTLALLMRALGEWYDIGALVLNLMLFVLVVFLTYRIAGTLAGRTAGLVAALLVALTFTRTNDLFLMNNTMTASALILLFSYQLQRTLTCVTPKRTIVLGLVLGLTVLGVPSAVLFLPLVALAILITQWPNWRAGLISSFTVAILGILVISPWAIRNYIAFDEFVLVRAGSGQIAFIGTLAVAATVAPDLIRSEIKPEWRAEGNREAVYKAAGTDGRRSLERQFQMQYARELGGPEFHAMNEAQRDKWFMNEARRFISNNPMLSAKLAYWKLERFITQLGPINYVLAFVAAIMWIVALMRRQIVTLTFGLTVLFYSLPFALIVSYFARYRLPIEPLIIIIATVGFWECVRRRP